ncbi:MAG: C4-type zinc ribbon domain-containing protein [Candidatus Caldatribacteriota bacterium]|nr:C4-type zinc ribbon domain-containing protein [Candidatus Caldatribacteriota bacterium]
MVKQIDTFLELQKIDSVLDQAENKRRTLPLNMVKIKKEIKEVTNRSKSKSEEFKNLKVKMKRIELDLKEKTNKIEKHQEDLFGGKISDIKELKQLQKVIAKYKEEKDGIEEDLLVVMEEAEDFHKIITSLGEDLKKKEEKFKKCKKETDEIILEIVKEINSLRNERKSLVEKIEDTRFLKQYELLRKGKGGNVILEVGNTICPGCYLDLPSDVIYHLKRDQSMVICPNCSRILIWKE